MRNRFLLAGLLSAALCACVSPQLDGLSEAACVRRADCAGGEACVQGACVSCGDELCDGFDNDCDDRVDEDFDLARSLEHCGACDAPCDGQCVEGHCEAIESCVPSEEVCNGRDDDCDEAIDEGLLNACGRCGEVPDEICNGEDDNCDGTIDEGLLNACGSCGVAPEEICNGIDDDCDGIADEDVTNACGTCGPLIEICNGEDDDCNGETDEGVTNACGGCGDEPPELCNGTDDDCDSDTDETYAGLGDPCAVGTGACRREGLKICSPDGSAVTCSETPGDSIDERCGNQVDDDCDGEIDEGFAGLGATCTVGTGACFQRGSLVCSPDGTTTVCNAQEGMPSEERCDLVDNDCDGEVDEGIDLYTDSQNCGECGHACELPAADSTCVDGFCTVASCDLGYEDRDLRDDNGCECNLFGGDEPDPAFIDANCDGVDGDLANSVFVSHFGRAEAQGTADDPINSLELALPMAAVRGLPILLEIGEHPLSTSVVVPVGLQIYGGYVFEPATLRWSRVPGQTTILGAVGVSPLITLQGGATLVLDNLTLRGSAAQTDQSAIGVSVISCLYLQLRDVVIEVGQGGAGTDGRSGARVADSAGRGDDSGAGGVNALCLRGTRGGDGGAPGAWGAEAGTPGANGEGDGGGEGGLGATGDQIAGSGFDAIPLVSLNGQPSREGGVVDALGQWSPAVGVSAEAGIPGGGGGGGGGGLSRSPTASALAGAGGGAGGCGGSAGQNGKGGGASIALLIGHECSLAHFERVSLSASPGGSGGRGGSGAPGGFGAAGGSAANLGSAELLAAGDGGRGANGGCGGDGAGGTGGPSLGLLLVGAWETAPAGISARGAQGGQPGAGGLTACADVERPAAPPGRPGVVLDIGCCPNPSDCGDLSCP